MLRAVLVYGGLAVLLRLGGKRDLAQLNSFDLVVMLLLSNMVQNAVIGNDNGLFGGLFSASVLIAINAVVIRVSLRYRRRNRDFAGSPNVLVRESAPIAGALRRLGLRRADVVAACRQQGAEHISEIKETTLSPAALPSW